MAATMRSARIGARDFTWGARTYVMGIVNVTPDSFSGDGITNLETAVAQARQMELDGADLIDIGGESTRPETWAGPGLSVDDELSRVIPVVERVAAAVTVPVSIDTYKAQVAERALAAGATLVNDVWGLRRDPAMAGTGSPARAAGGLLHNKTGGGDRDLPRGIAQNPPGRVGVGWGAGIRGRWDILGSGLGFRGK